MTNTHRIPTQPVGADLTRLLKALKLGALADTLPERAALARQHKLNHPGFDAHLLWREGRAHHAQEVRRINQEQGCPAGR